MNEIMQSMNQTMNHAMTGGHVNLKEMGQIMSGMSEQMHNMGMHLEKGTMDEKSLQQMQDRMRSLQHRMLTLQNEGAK
jgi:hypothetical protein